MMIAVVCTASAVLLVGPKAQAGVAFDVEHPAAVSGQLAQQHLLELFQKKMKTNGPELVARARNDFLDYLRLNSPIASEKLLSGKMEDDELESRVDVFLRDRAALSGATAKTEREVPRKLVADLLRREPAIAGTDPERLALADRFLERLGELSPTGRNELMEGKMSADELQSRVRVFISDIRAEAAAAPVDPKVAAMHAFVDSYVKANFGERANDVTYRAEIEADGVKRGCVIFRKRPGKIRMHIVEDGLVVGILAFDGAAGWRQEPGRAGVPSTGAELDALKQMARFDDPLVDYRERGTEVKLGEKTETGLQQLHIRESDGTEMIAVIDPANFNETLLRTRQPDGTWRELRFSDYRKVGALNLAYVQEDWANGKLRSTTRITEARLDSGLIDQFFTCPANPVLSYMDYMGGLAAIKAQQKLRPPALPQSTGGAR